MVSYVACSRAETDVAESKAGLVANPSVGPDRHTFVPAEEPLGDLVDVRDHLAHLVAVLQQGQDAIVAEQLVYVVEVTATTRRWLTVVIGSELDGQPMDVDELLEQCPSWVKHLHLERCEVLVLVESGARVAEHVAE